VSVKKYFINADYYHMGENTKFVNFLVDLDINDDIDIVDIIKEKLALNGFYSFDDLIINIKAFNPV